MAALNTYLSFGGKRLEQFGLYISGGASHGAPERDYEKVSVPGRNGDLIFDNGAYKNIEITYHAGVRKPVAPHIRDLRNFLLSLRGYQRLEDSFHPETYRMAVFKGSIDPKLAVQGRIGELDLKFDCKPQRFLVEGEKEIVLTSGTPIYNPTDMTALPLVRVYGTGTLAIGEETIVITQADGYTDIDCDIMDAYKGTTNCNGNIQLSSGNFFHLEPGNNGVSITGSITGVTLIPRWWIL